MIFPRLNIRSITIQNPTEGQPDLPLTLAQPVQAELVPSGFMNWIRRNAGILIPVTLLTGGGGTAWWMNPAEPTTTAVNEPASKTAPSQVATTPDQSGLSAEIQGLRYTIDQMAKQQAPPAVVTTPPATPAPPVRVQLVLPDHLVVQVEEKTTSKPTADYEPAVVVDPKAGMTPTERRQYEIWVERK